MWNWDDEIKLSRLEVEQARRLAVAPLDEAIAHTDHLLAEVRQLDASPERERLIERILALREERLAIKRERLAHLDRMLPQTERVVPVRAGDLTAAFNRYDYGDHKVIRRNGQVVSFESRNALLRPLRAVGSPRRRHGLRIAGARGLDFVGSMLRRKAAGRLASRCGKHARLPDAHPFHSRSIASRSRMLAAVGAPPWIVE
jgi:hypothetical protein